MGDCAHAWPFGAQCLYLLPGGKGTWVMVPALSALLPWTSQRASLSHSPFPHYKRGVRIPALQGSALCSTTGKGQQKLVPNSQSKKHWLELLFLLIYSFKEPIFPLTILLQAQS